MVKNLTHLICSRSANPLHEINGDSVALKQAKNSEHILLGNTLNRLLYFCLKPCYGFCIPTHYVFPGTQMDCKNVWYLVNCSLFLPPASVAANTNFVRMIMISGVNSECIELLISSKENLGMAVLAKNKLRVFFVIMTTTASSSFWFR